MFGSKAVVGDEVKELVESAKEGLRKKARNIKNIKVYC